jgi:hypothetical protein
MSSDWNVPSLGVGPGGFNYNTGHTAAKTCLFPDVRKRSVVFICLTFSTGYVF